MQLLLSSSLQVSCSVILRRFAGQGHCVSSSGADMLSVAAAIVIVIWSVTVVVVSSFALLSAPRLRFHPRRVGSDVVVTKEDVSIYTCR